MSEIAQISYHYYYTKLSANMLLPYIIISLNVLFELAYNEINILLVKLK